MRVLEERPLTLAEVKELLRKLEERDKELDVRANKVKQYLNNLDILPYDKAIQLRKELEELKLPRVRTYHIVKIVDLLPEDNDDLRVIFYGEVTDKEIFDKILEIVKKYK